MKSLTIGTRGSRLALIQAETVRKALQGKSKFNLVELKIVKTTGDLVADIPLEKIGDKGIFIKELENALLNKEIDLAVHSMKDVPTTLPEGLVIGAVLPRSNPLDVLICSGPESSLDGLPPGARIGSGSLRRRAQLLGRWPHLDIRQIRGNIDTRFRKLSTGEYDGLILAYAGVERMGWVDRISEVIPASVCLPAAGQGAIGVEIRSDDPVTKVAVGTLHCVKTEAAVTAERFFLAALEGGCQVPVGALAVYSENELVLEGMVASLDGSVVFHGKRGGSPSVAPAIGAGLADSLLKQGCGKILDQIRQECSKFEQ